VELCKKTVMEDYIKEVECLSSLESRLVVHMHFEQSIADIAWLCGAVRQICCSKSENTRTANVNDCYQ